MLIIPKNEKLDWKLTITFPIVALVIVKNEFKVKPCSELNGIRATERHDTPAQPSDVIIMDFLENFLSSKPAE